MLDDGENFWFKQLMKTSGNTILITGGTSGIGFEMSKQFLKAGNTVIVTGRDKIKLEKIKAAMPELHIYQSDVSNPLEITDLFKKLTGDFPALNILINNAGIMKSVNIHNSQETLEKLTQEIDINLKGPIQMSKIFIEHLKKQKTAAIVNVSSGLAFVPLPISPVYCATKAGLHSFTQSLRAQLKNTSIKVFELAPPATATELLSSMDQEDMKGVTIMPVTQMVTEFFNGFAKDQLEICPGQSKQLRFLSRVAPGFILKQMSKTVDRMLN